MAIDYAIRSRKELYAWIPNYNAEQTTEAIEILKRLGTPCLIQQVKYLMIVRGSEVELLDILEQ
jgi:L-glyceraldehyde 3-phosphate reductase